MSHTEPTHAPDDAHTPTVNESMSKAQSKPVADVTQTSVKTVLGWTFFDPCNLLSIILLSAAAILAFNEMRQISLSHTWAVILYYGCLTAFLRGYFYYYYHGGKVARVLVYLPLLAGILVGSAYWSDAAKGFAYLSDLSLRMKPASDGLHWAGLLNIMCAIALTVHIIMPRRWLVKITDDIENRVPDDLGVSKIRVPGTGD